MTHPKNAAALRGQLVDKLAAAGRLTTTWIADAVRHIDRAPLFMSDIYRDVGGGWYQAVHPDQPRWLEMVYADVPLIVQLDGDSDRWGEAHAEPVPGTPTAATMEPSRVATMLDALDLGDHDRVLVVGGVDPYLIACLGHRLGSAAVTVVEPQHGIATRAAAALRRRGGAQPQFLGGEAASTHLAAAAPYTRVVAARPLARIPQAWVDQTAPGGVIIAGLDLPLADDPIVRLVVNDDGTAHGRFLPDVLQMRPLPPLDVAQFRARETATQQRATALSDDVGADCRLLAALMLGNVDLTCYDEHDWLVETSAPAPGSSWARRSTTDMVTQHGPRRLWDELEQAYAVWRHAGRPNRQQVLLTVTAAGHRYALETGLVPVWDEAQTPLWKEECV